MSHFLFVSFSQCFLVSFLYYFTFMSDEKAWSFPVSLLGLTGPLLVRMLLDGAELCDPPVLTGRALRCYWAMGQDDFCS